MQTKVADTVKTFWVRLAFSAGKTFLYIPTVFECMVFMYVSTFRLSLYSKTCLIEPEQFLSAVAMPCLLSAMEGGVTLWPPRFLQLPQPHGPDAFLASVSQNQMTVNIFCGLWNFVLIGAKFNPSRVLYPSTGSTSFGKHHSEDGYYSGSQCHPLTFLPFIPILTFIVRG